MTFAVCFIETFILCNLRQHYKHGAWTKSLYCSDLKNQYLFRTSSITLNSQIICFKIDIKIHCFNMVYITKPYYFRISFLFIKKKSLTFSWKESQENNLNKITLYFFIYLFFFQKIRFFLYISLTVLLFFILTLLNMAT